MVKVAGRFGRYGYRMVTGMLRAEGWVVNHKRVERIWREEGLKVPKKQPKRGRLWLTDGSCIRLRPLYRHHVWAYDFVADRTHDGRPLKMLTVLDEYSRECLAIVVARRLRADDVLQTLSELFVEHGPPANLRSDNGPEFTAKVVREWLERVEVKTLYIEPESIPKLVETRVTSGRSGCGMSLAIGMDDPEFLLNRGTERREVAIAE